MSDATQDLPDDQPGHFVGGTFVRPADADGEGDGPTTAQQVEHEAEEGDPAQAAAAPAEAQESLDDATTSTVAASDVEGTSTEPAPGERNEPV